MTYMLVPYAFHTAVLTVHTTSKPQGNGGVYAKNFPFPQSPTGKPYGFLSRALLSPLFTRTMSLPNCIYRGFAALALLRDPS